MNVLPWNMLEAVGGFTSAGNPGCVSNGLGNPGTKVAYIACIFSVAFSPSI